jgi:signal transduction histidine kinase
MQTTSRRYAIIFFVLLGFISVGLALALNITWVIHWREVGMVALGVIFFAFIIAGLTLNTIFLVREIRRNEQHDSFINSVTHELKTPIASIRLYLETLRSRPLDDAQRDKFYGVMLQDTDRLLHTVEQVLRAGQLAHLATRDFQPVRLGDLAADCVQLQRTRHRLATEAITFRDYTSGPSESEVLGDADELRTAVLNVLENSIKYSQDAPQIAVTLLPEGKDVLLRITDRGVGIPRGELKRIFRRFYRVPQIIKYRAKGTGLGLFIVRSIARRHGGNATAESEGTGTGATITIRLPRRTA